MLALLLSWLHVAWLSLVIGVSGLRLGILFLREKKWDAATCAPDYIVLAGFLLTTALTSAISLFSPINLWVNLFFLLVGVAGTVAFAGDLKIVLNGILKRWREASPGYRLAISAAVGISTLAAFIDIGESDTWFYHSQSVLWIKEYAAVPGLGNIHGRFAFNSHFFVALALFSHYFSEEQLVFPLLSFFFMLFTIRLLANMNHGIKNKDWFFLTTNTLLLVLFSYQVCNHISGTGTDEITVMLLLYVFFLFWEITQRPQAGSGKLIIFWIALFSAITFKISSIFMIALAAFLLPQMLGKRKTALYAGLTALILLPFIGRNIVLSGYLLYPLPELDVLQVDWKIPKADVIVEKELIEGWAKQPEGMTSTIGFAEIPLILQLPFDEWFRIWWPAQSLRWKAIMILSLLSFVPMIRSLFQKRFAMAAMYGAILVNLSFWFFEAPEPRFAYAFLFLGTALVLAELSLPILRILKPGAWVLPVFGVLLVLLVIFRKDMRYFTPWDNTYLLCPRYAIKIETQPYQALGFTLLVPGKAAPAKGYFCHNAPLPCTPFPKPNLALRGDAFQNGFKIVPDSKAAQPADSNTQ